jgi:hypothetical protein
LKTYNVYSTLSCDQTYTRDKKESNGLLSTIDSVTIKGGAGIVNDRLYSPSGTRNEVTEYELDVLEDNPVFQIHKKNGFIEITEKAEDAEKIAQDMSQDDGSRPLTKEKADELSVPAEVDEFETGLDAGKKKRK